MTEAGFSVAASSQRQRSVRRGKSVRQVKRASEEAGPSRREGQRLEIPMGRTKAKDTSTPRTLVQGGYLQEQEFHECIGPVQPPGAVQGAERVGGD